jgi:hypothetical protein
LKERELEFKERKKEKSLSALKSGSAHTALAVQYNPRMASEFPQIASLTAVLGLELFLFPKGEALLNKTERGREREGQPESSTIARPWWWGLSWKTDSTGVPDDHGHVPRHPFPVWHNLYQPQVTAGPFLCSQI